MISSSDLRVALAFAIRSADEDDEDEEAPSDTLRRFLAKLLLVLLEMYWTVKNSQEVLVHICVFFHDTSHVD